MKTIKRVIKAIGSAITVGFTAACCIGGFSDIASIAIMKAIEKHK